MNTLVFYVDVDDTFVRSFGKKRIPIKKTIDYIQKLKNLVLFFIAGVVEVLIMQEAVQLNLEYMIVLNIFYQNPIF